MNLPRLSLRTLLYFFLLVVIFILVAEGGYFLGIRNTEEKENEIKKYASSSIYYLFGTLTAVGENTWAIKPEKTGKELNIKDEITLYPPTFWSFSDNQATISAQEEIGVGDRVRMEVAITSKGETDVLSLTKLSQ